MDNDEFNAEQFAIKSRFVEMRGYWNEFWEAILVLDPKFLEKYLEFSSHPWSDGCLDPKVREFVYIAIDASTTHLYEPGLRQHIENARRLGASDREIMEVLELTAGLGIHSCIMGFSALLSREGKEEEG